MSPGVFDRVINDVEQSEVVLQLTLDVEAVKRGLARAERGLEALLSRFGRAEGDQDLRPYVEREVARAAREKEEFRKTIAELEARLGEANQIAADLRRLADKCADGPGSLDALAFEDRRLALRVLGVKVRANGNDSERWCFEAGVEVRWTDESKIAYGPGLRGDSTHGHVSGGTGVRERGGFSSIGDITTEVLPDPHPADETGDGDDDLMSRIGQND